MEKLRVRDADDAVSGLKALREILTKELAEMEDIVMTAAEGKPSDARRQEMMAVCQRLRTGLLSGIASVDETLGWVHVCAEKDPEGNELDCVRALPYVSFSLPS